MYNLFQNQKSTNIAFYLENTTDNVANFCFYCVCLQVSEEKMRVLKKTVDSRFGRSSAFFLNNNFVISLKRYGTVAIIMSLRANICSFV
jgi:hypothetical protein